VPRVALLACGHSLPVSGGWRPPGGTWVTCPSPLCQSQRRIVSVAEEMQDGGPPPAD
jgi:hypothetical protein